MRLLTVPELAALHPGEGTWRVQGFVALVHACPPCPPGAHCKPCMADNVVLTATPRRLVDYSEMRPDDLIVFVPKAAALAVGQRVLLRVRALPVRTTNGPGNDLELIDAEAAP